MKHILAIILIVLTSFFGCSDDIVNNNSQSNNVVFELDSLGIETQTSGGVNLIEYASLIPFNDSTIKVEFTGHTNLDSTCQMSLNVFATKNGAGYFDYGLYANDTINQNHSIIINRAGDNCIYGFMAQITYINPELIETEGRGYIYFKNIKVSRIQ